MSALLTSIQQQLATSVPAMITILKQFPLCGVDNERALELGFDTDSDAVASAAFAWSIDDVVTTGADDQLNVELHIWQGADDADASLTLEVRRSSDNDLLKRARANATADSDWTEVAKNLYEQIREYENRASEPGDEWS